MAGMAIMFVFFTVSFGVTTLLEEKENGTLARLLAAPIPRDSILAAKGLVSYTLGVLATMSLFIVATVLMGAEWGSWLGVLTLVLAACLTAVALMAVVAGLAKRAEGAGAVQSIIAVGLALLGGSWFPVSGEGLLGMLARATPHFWFLEGLDNLAGASSWTVVWPSVVALIIIAIAAGVPATMLLRRKLAP
jgi:ABC-2 type transport system permease protein